MYFHVFMDQIKLLLYVIFSSSGIDASLNLYQAFSSIILRFSLRVQFFPYFLRYQLNRLLHFRAIYTNQKNTLNEMFEMDGEVLRLLR